MTSNTQHDIKAALRFLENLYAEIIHGDDIKDLQDPLVLMKMRETIDLFQKILST